MKRLNDFEVTDIRALAAAYPRMVKLTPDYGNIRKALSLGVKLPGVEITAPTDSDDLLQSDHPAI